MGKTQKNYHNTNWLQLRENMQKTYIKLKLKSKPRPTGPSTPLQTAHISVFMNDCGQL